jgi:hypothetical protein
MMVATSASTSLGFFAIALLAISWSTTGLPVRQRADTASTERRGVWASFINQRKTYSKTHSKTMVALKCAKTSRPTTKLAKNVVHASVLRKPPEPRPLDCCCCCWLPFAMLADNRWKWRDLRLATTTTTTTTVTLRRGVVKKL